MCSIASRSSSSLEVYREPTPDPGAPYGWRYWSGARLDAAAVASPLALPSVRLAVRALFG